ncbi:MAG TPA: hypothetical protein VN808_09035 [Stellaceae bacterium]|nr:hypothetical protein [Stellaceae bacterium]
MNGRSSLDQRMAGVDSKADIACKHQDRPLLPEAVEKRVSGGGRRAVFRRREGRNGDRQIGACGLSEAIRL